MKSPSMNPNSAALTFRYDVQPADVDALTRMVMGTGFFYAHEVAVAKELVEERLTRGRASGYEFVIAEESGQLLGYTCFGEIACTQGSYDLYWIVVDKAQQKRGIGTALLQETEARVRALHGRRIYIETSARPQYEPTRAFYLRAGYHQAALLPEFYGPDDGKLIYERVL